MKEPIETYLVVGEISAAQSVVDCRVEKMFEEVLDAFSASALLIQLLETAKGYSKPTQVLKEEQVQARIESRRPRHSR